MARLEHLTKGASITGVVPGGAVEVVAGEWFGEGGLNLVYRTADGALGSRLLYRDDEPTLGVLERARPWSFDGDGHLFRLAAEAHRIGLAYLFDPMLAVHTSLVEPLPHQLTAVYGEMLPRQPLRFLLADDPGSGKTIMAGLLMKELLVRGDLNRCLVCAPGALVEQWQDELWQKFQLPFELLIGSYAAKFPDWHAGVVFSAFQLAGGVGGMVFPYLTGPVAASAGFKAAIAVAAVPALIVAFLALRLREASGEARLSARTEGSG